MFEVCIIGNLPRENKELGRVKGAAICARPLGATAWGSDERKFFRIVQWPITDERDQAVYDELQRQIKDGIEHPSVDYPFASEDGEMESTKGIDLEALPAKEKADTLDTSKATATLEAVHVQKVAITKGVK